MFIKLSKLYYLFACIFLMPIVMAYDKPSNQRHRSDAFFLQTINDQFSVPWAIEQWNNTHLIISERQGTLWLLDLSNNQRRQIKGLADIRAQGQGGLLDLAVYTEQKTQWLYFTFVAKSSGNTTLARAQLDEALSTLTHLQILYQGQTSSRHSRHFGSRIAFDDKGFVFFSIGDRGERDRYPQSLASDAGKILRLHANGDIPKDNPFVSTKGANAAIYSLGHRNPQGLLFNASTGQLISHEHGPRGGDELNIISEGVNYGWPVITYGINYIGSKITDLTAKEGLQQPLHYWTPSIAPSDIIYLNNSAFEVLNNHYLIGSLKFGQLITLSIDKKTDSTDQRLLLTDIGRVRSLLQTQQGAIYVGIDNKGIFQLVP